MQYHNAIITSVDAAAGTCTYASSKLGKRYVMVLMFTVSASWLR